MIHKTFIEHGQGQVARVTFTLPESLWADAIYLVGDFDGWDRSAHPFQRDHAGHWTLSVDLEVGRTYQFRCLRDDEWMNDNQADGYVQNSYGSTNFLVVTDPHFEANGSRDTTHR